MNRKVIIFFGLIISGCFLFVAGPSYIFGLYNNAKASNTDDDYIFKMHVAGFSMVGFFISFVVYPLVSEIFCLAHIKEGVLNDMSLIDKSTGVFNMFF